MGIDIISVFNPPKTEIKPCPFCGEIVAEITNVKETEECANFEDEACPQFENAGNCGVVAVVCNFSKGGCGASSGWRVSEKAAIEAWNSRGNQHS